MNLIQVLDCNATLGNCCSSPTIASVLDITRKIFGLIQVIAPIILIVMATVQVLLLTINPEEKDAFKKIYNKFLAAIIIFILPIILNVIMGLLPNSINISACWNEASNISYSSEGKYVEIEKDKLVIEAEKVEAVYNKDDNKKEETTSKIENNPNAKVVEYAMQFKGGKYAKNGHWDGEKPYQPTNCVRFIKGVYKHFGVELTGASHTLINNSNVHKISEKEIRAGDIVVYNQKHSAMLTGKGKQIIHDTSAHGVTVYKNYNYSGHTPKYFLRVEGVK